MKRLRKKKRKKIQWVIQSMYRDHQVEYLPNDVYSDWVEHMLSAKKFNSRREADSYLAKPIPSLNLVDFKYKVIGIKI